MLNGNENSEEFMVCYTNTGINWRCKCGFENINDADAFTSTNIPNKNNGKYIAKIITTKTYYPSFIKHMQAKWYLRNSVNLE